MWYSQEKMMTSVVTSGCREVGSSSGGRKKCIRIKYCLVFCLFVLPYHSFFFFFLVKLMLFSLLSIIGYTPVFRESVFCY